MGQSLVLLHGFLGSPSDFGRVVEHLQHDAVFIPSLYDRGPLDPTHGLLEWVQNFKLWLQEKNIIHPLLAGYSLGGRLALHVAALASECVNGVVAISAHPGLTDPTEKSLRTAWEERWSQIFLNEPLVSAVEQWQKQDVFLNTEPSVLDRELDPTLISQSLENWSTARHEFAPQDLLTARVPLRWLVGQRDHKYMALLSEFLQSRPQDLTVIEDAGHRVHLDAPWALAQELNRFTLSNPN